MRCCDCKHVSVWFSVWVYRKRFFFAAIKILFYRLFVHKTKTVELTLTEKKFFNSLKKKNVLPAIICMIIRKKRTRIFGFLWMSFSMLNKLLNEIILSLQTSSNRKDHKYLQANIEFNRNDLVQSLDSKVRSY